jgi:hypothetical protein
MEIIKGAHVRVFWGYGSAFRASGLGTIVRIFPGSVQVRLEHDVADPFNPGQIGWKAGHVLKGIPRSGSWNRVESIQSSEYRETPNGHAVISDDGKRAVIFNLESGRWHACAVTPLLINGRRALIGLNEASYEREWTQPSPAPFLPY